MNEKNKNLYHEINKSVEKEIIDIFNGDYEYITFGTLDENGYPFLSKILPLYHENKIYLLLSDLSEHTKNIKRQNKSSIYFALKEIHKQKLNNPRLTIIGTTEVLNLKKNSPMFSNLLINYSTIEKSAELWGKFDDFNFYYFKIIKYIYVKGFGKAYIKNFK